MSVRLEKEWQRFDADVVGQLAGHMGVYQLGRADGHVLHIGYAGGASPLGLRGELATHLAASTGSATHFRFEITTAYLSRFRELVAVHVHDHGAAPGLPAGVEPAGLGRVQPG